MMNVRWIILAVVCMAALSSASCAITLSEGKRQPDGATILLPMNFVTYVAPDFFYIEDANRSCGIRVEKPGHVFQVGDGLYVKGILSTNAYHERRLSNC